MRPLNNLIILLVLIISACAPFVQTPSPQDIQTAIAETLAAIPEEPSDTPTTETSPQSPSSTSQPIPRNTSTPEPPIAGIVNVAFLNLRTGPSTLHTVLQSFEAGTPITALRREFTNDWVEVSVGEGDEELTGWMLIELLDLEGDVTHLELAQIPEGLIVRGRVEDSESNPINDVSIALIYRIDEDELRSDISSNDNGEFVFYLPEELTGTIDIQIVGLDCDSVIVNTLCALEGYFNLERRVFIVPPQSEPIIFTYEIATTTLTGIVYNANGDPIANVLVVAERDDGAETFGSSAIDGSFEIPAGEGSWEIYTVVLDPRLESDRTPINITNEKPDPFELQTP